MIRLTTPVHSFQFKSDPALYSRLLITYAQEPAIVLEKELPDLTITEEITPSGTVWIATVKLTQEETKAFTPRLAVKVQVRALTADGTALASEKYTMSVVDVLNDEVLT